MRFQIDLASLIVGNKFTVFALFYFLFEGNFPSTSSWGGLYLEGRFHGGFFALPLWGAYIWRGLFSEFLRYVFYKTLFNKKDVKFTFGGCEICVQNLWDNTEAKKNYIASTIERQLTDN